MRIRTAISRKKSGQTIVEYVGIIAVLGYWMMLTIPYFVTELTNMTNEISTAVDMAAGGQSYNSGGGNSGSSGSGGGDEADGSGGNNGNGVGPGGNRSGGGDGTNPGGGGNDQGTNNPGKGKGKNK